MIEGEGEKAVTHPLFSIPEILHKILEIGRRGVQIKRFKGLGEMNAKELFETTMNPEKRKLLKVDLNDDNAVEADQMFTRLDGRRGRAAPAVHRRQRAERAQPGCLENDEARITNVKGNASSDVVPRFVTRHSSFVHFCPVYNANEKVEPINVAEEISRSFLDYSMSVIISRALPDARDGLKPSQRRILYAMHDLVALSRAQALEVREDLR